MCDHNSVRHILYNTALQFRRRPTLEIGCSRGWSTCHLTLAGVELDVVAPVLQGQDHFESVVNSLTEACVMGTVNLVGGSSPEMVSELAVKHSRKWSLFFIDDDHRSPLPLQDAMACEKYAADDVLILFHDLVCPDVAAGLAYLAERGWRTMIYQTMQIMGVAWRGNVQPIEHRPDAGIVWPLPLHLRRYPLCGR